jgi:chaperonin GroES
MKYKPLDDRIVIKPEAEKTTTSGGLFLPANRQQEKSTKGVVIAVGLGRVLTNGQRVAPQVAVGDVVLFGRFAGCDIEQQDGSEVKIIREADLLAVEA